MNIAGWVSGPEPSVPSTSSWQERLHQTLAATTVDVYGGLGEHVDGRLVLVHGQLASGVVP